MSVRTYIVESLLPGGSSSTGGTAAGGDVLLDAPAHAHDGPSHTGLLPLEAISTTETDTTKVAAPDGTGGIAFVSASVADAELNIEGGQDVPNHLGSPGATVTVDPTDGNVFDLTLTADLALTLNAPAGSGQATLAGWFTQSGGPWTITVTPAGGGSFVWDGGVTPTLPASGTFRVLFDRIPGTTNDWVGDLVGAGSTVAALDDLSDVVLTSPAAGDRLRYDGAEWINSALRWEPHVAYDGTVVLNGNGDPVMVEVS